MLGYNPTYGTRRPRIFRKSDGKQLMFIYPVPCDHEHSRVVLESTDTAGNTCVQAVSNITGTSEWKKRFLEAFPRAEFDESLNCFDGREELIAVWL